MVLPGVRHPPAHASECQKHPGQPLRTVSSAYPGQHSVYSRCHGNTSPDSHRAFVLLHCRPPASRDTCFYIRTGIILTHKLLYWEGSSKKDFKKFPIDVQKDMGVALFVVQLGGTPDSAKPWKGLGPGVYEMVGDHRGDTFRAAYTVRIGDAVHVLHAFQKKSKAGISTPQPDVELIAKRLRLVLARYAANGRNP